MHLSPPELALVCVLMLRGRQTTGELRANASRLHEFAGIEEVEATVNSLISHEPEPLVLRLPRQPGQKEARFAHLLAGAPSEEIISETHVTKASSPRQGDRERIETLEREIAALTEEVETLKQQFGAFKKQFE